MPKKARPEAERLVVDPRQVDGAAEEATAPTGVPPAAPEKVRRSAVAEHRPGRDPRGQHGWADVGMRSKAGVETRARAGAMLRLSRVMKNR